MARIIKFERGFIELMKNGSIILPFRNVFACPIGMKQLEIFFLPLDILLQMFAKKCITHLFSTVHEYNVIKAFLHWRKKNQWPRTAI